MLKNNIYIYSIYIYTVYIVYNNSKIEKLNCCIICWHKKNGTKRMGQMKRKRQNQSQISLNQTQQVTHKKVKTEKVYLKKR